MLGLLRGMVGLFALRIRNVFSDFNIKKGNRWICIERNIKMHDFRSAILLVYGLHSRQERREL